MKIYLDNCSLQRPFDDKSQLRIRLEAEAILAILSLFESGDIEMVASEVIEYELDGIVVGDKKSFCKDLLSKCNLFIELTDDIEDLAKHYISNGVKPLDALHLACAVEHKVDFFCSCDDLFVRKARELDIKGVIVVKPLELIEEIEK